MIDQIIQYIRHIFGLPGRYFTGLLEDTRLQSEKDKDYLHEERVLPAASENLYGGAPIANNASPYLYYNQNSTSACVPHAVGLCLNIERMNDVGNYQLTAPMYPYRLRSNYPQEGSALQEMFEKYRTRGAPLYTTLPTPASEQEADALVITAAIDTEAQIYKGKTYFTLAVPNNIDTLATIASQKHGVAIILFATYDEYAVEYPQILVPNLVQQSAEIRHCVSILPNSGFMKDGKKYLSIQDSAYFGQWKIRHLSEDFIKARIFGAGYWDTVAPLGAGARPHYKFTQTLRIGSTGTEVQRMQELLISEGLMPTGMNSGTFGGITLAGVKAFQSKYASEILIPQGLTQPTGVWGSASITKANQLCTP